MIANGLLSHLLDLDARNSDCEKGHTIEGKTCQIAALVMSLWNQQLHLENGGT